MMSSDTIHLQTRSHNYDKPADQKEDQSSSGKAPSTSSLKSSSTVPLSIDKTTLDMILCPPKSTLRKAIFNPNARAAQFYNVVEDLDFYPRSAPKLPHIVQELVYCIRSFRPG